MKKGDKVFCVSDLWIDINKGELCTVESILMNSVAVNGVYRNASSFKLALKSNKLNLKLYPDATEVSGYLRID